MGQNPPQIKEGLWSIHRVSSDNSESKKNETTSMLCRNHAYDAYARGLAKNMKGCTIVSETYVAGKYSVHTRCTIGGRVADSTGTTVFFGDTSSHSESHSTYSPALNGLSELTMIQDQKYMGSCPANMQPGDAKTAQGTITHLWRH